MRPHTSHLKINEISTLSNYSHLTSLNGWSYMQISIGAIIIFILIGIIAYFYYKKYRTNIDYNDTPQNFSNRPDLGLTQKFYLSNSKFEVTQQKMNNSFTASVKEMHEGQLTQLKFSGKEEVTVFYHRKQDQQATYFEVEIISLNSTIEIGYIHCDDLKALKENGGFDTLGVSVNNFGNVIKQGKQLFNLDWSLTYGDVIGIGLTMSKDISKIHRAWISKNGVLLNPPPKQEVQKWIQNSDLNLEKERQDLQLIKKKEQLEKLMKKTEKTNEKQTNLFKLKIPLDFGKQFIYYPVISCLGNKSDLNPSIININVGGQNFRMHDKDLKKGLLS